MIYTSYIRLYVERISSDARKVGEISERAKSADSAAKRVFRFRGVRRVKREKGKKGKIAGLTCSGKHTKGRKFLWRKGGGMGRTMLARGLELEAERTEKTSAEVASTGSRGGEVSWSARQLWPSVRVKCSATLPRRSHWLFRLRGFPSRVDASIPTIPFPLPPSRF